MKKTHSIPLLIAFWMASAPLAAQEQEPAWKRLQHETVPLPPTYEQRVRDSGSVLELSLQDAIRLALINNLELAIEDYNEDLTRERVVETRGFYDPTLTTRLSWNSAEIPSSSQLDAGIGVVSRLDKRWQLNTTFTQNVPGGGFFQALFNNNRFKTTNNFAQLNPSYGTFFSLQYRQPLLKGFKETPTERTIKLFNLDTEITQRQFEAKVSEIVQRVENQYWELVFAIQNYEANRQSVELAIVQFENNKKRARIGSLAPIEITSSRTEVAGREQAMVQSEIQIIRSENGLKTLLAPDTRDNLWNLSMLPTDTPEMEDLTISLDEAVATALKRRPELDQLRLQMEKNDVDRQYLRKDGKWAVDVLAGLSTNGTAGTPTGLSPLEGNFSQTLKQAFGFDFPTYFLAVELQIPLRNRTNEGRLMQAALGRRQLQQQQRQREQTILQEVRNAYQSIHTQRRRVDISRQTREYAQEQLAGEMKRFEAGLSTNFEVLRFQRDLTNSRITELRSLIDYRQALTELRQAMYTIVDDNDFSVARSARDGSQP